jgi:hypothetical protein
MTVSLKRNPLALNLQNERQISALFKSTDKRGHKAIKQSSEENLLKTPLKEIPFKLWLEKKVEVKETLDWLWNKFPHYFNFEKPLFFKTTLHQDVFNPAMKGIKENPYLRKPVSSFFKVHDIPHSASPSQEP